MLRYFYAFWLAIEILNGLKNERYINLRRKIVYRVGPRASLPRLCFCLKLIFIKTQSPIQDWKLSPKNVAQNAFVNISSVYRALRRAIWGGVF